MNIEDRVISLEATIGTLGKVATQQLARNRETDERLTMLLGIVAAQERDIKATLVRLDDIEQHLVRLEERFVRLEERFVRLEERFVRLESSVEERFVHLESRMDERFDTIIALLGSNRPKPPMQ